MKTPRLRSLLLPLGVLPLLAATLAGCPDDPTVVPPIPDASPDVVPIPGKATWHDVTTELPEALLSVSGTSRDDVFVVGADKGKGPRVERFDGTTWKPLATGQHGDLWWVHALPGGPTFMAGASGMVLRYDGQKFERMPTPGLAKQTVFGVFARSATDVYAVGGASGRDGFIWHYDGKAFTEVRLPDTMPRLEKGEIPGLFKVWGEGDDLWVVGGGGTLLHKKGDGPFAVVATNMTETLFTVHGAKGKVYAVGGASNGKALEIDAATLAVRDVSPEGAGLLQGVFATGTRVVATGERGTVYELGPIGKLAAASAQPGAKPQSYHAAWASPDGEVWAVGGEVLSPALAQGAIVHFAERAIPGVTKTTPDGGTDGTVPTPVCPPEVVSIGADKSVARRWNEQMMSSIRRDLPRPTVHARNLFHVSAAMWDAWAAYSTTANAVFVPEPRHRHRRRRRAQRGRQLRRLPRARPPLQERHRRQGVAGLLPRAADEAGLRPERHGRHRVTRRAPSATASARPSSRRTSATARTRRTTTPTPPCSAPSTRRSRSSRRGIGDETSTSGSRSTSPSPPPRTAFRWRPACRATSARSGVT
jgi:hypothetical protein